MNNFKIEIEVNLGKGTLEALAALASAFAAPSAPSDKPQVMETKAEAPQPTVIGADPEGTGAEDIGDLPAGNTPEPAPAPTPEPAPAPVPSESDARNAVQAARKRGVSAAAIKAYMKEAFGIATSVECPAERRQELIDGLAKLAA